MDKALKFLKSLAHGFSVSLLSLLAFTAIVILALSLNITQRQTTKDWLYNSGFYHNAVDGMSILARQGAEESNNGAATSIEGLLGQGVLTDKQVDDILHRVITPAFLQEQTEGVIDSTYNWLDGSVSSLNFSFDLSSLTNNLIDTLSAQVDKQAKSYPVCTSAQLSQITDPLKAGCLPPGVSAKTLSATFKSELKSQDIPTDDLSFSSEDIGVSQDIQTKAPEIYSTLNRLPMIFSLVGLGLILLVVFTDKTIVKGLKKAGQTLFLAGLFSWIGFFALHKLTSHLDFPNKNVPVEFVDKIIKPLTSEILGDIAQTGMWIALFVTISGVVLWLVPFLWQKSHPETVPDAAAVELEGDKQLPEPVISDEPDKDSKSKSNADTKKDAKVKNN